ncbi:Methyltransferase domain-containing protein [Chitinophaga ginsengisegetis]|uniref:Methyltransferase domain-containing protein n=1 Tax=Chitinophaga ginsengisegetis TaxID=393003 RepID=A0A1T5NKC7_9BACT|nr:class I SAM-dependent methyltransferase [Chitinophaga ginsengisegetis]SKD00608.1 Methyltransferase domain-containing protein [Chitinophaga ginsengisegetis]
MEKINRTPFQGIVNIVRFNWHLYVLFLLLLVGGLLFTQYTLTRLMLCGAAIATLSSLVVSWYIYDGSDLYTLLWLDDMELRPYGRIVNIHAGFDETSQLLANKYPEADLQVFDFYNPEMHTEVSIERARKRYAPYAGTKTVSTVAVPLEPASVDVVFLLLAAHEIRDPVERTIFFKELRRCLAADGRIVVLEHLRDTPNFIAYTIGFLHFFSGATWRRTFEGAQLTLEKEKKITPFLSAFILQKNGIAS